MKQRPEVKAFKQELENYSYYLEREKKLSGMIDYCYDLLGGVRGVNPAAVRSNSPVDKEREYRIRDEIAKHEKNRKRNKEKIAEIEETVNLMPEDAKEIVRLKYLKGKTYVQISEIVYMSPSTVKDRLNRAIIAALR